MLSIIATAYLQAMLDVCTPYIKYVCIDIAMDLAKAQAEANEKMIRFLKEKGVPQPLYEVVIFVNDLCENNALTWDYTTDGTLLHVTLYTSLAPVLTVRLYYRHKYSVVIQKNWDDKSFGTIDELKVCIEDRIKRLQADANEKMIRRFLKEKGVPRPLYEVVVFVHHLCNDNALTWDYTTDGTMLHVTLSTSLAPVFTVRLFYGQEHSLVIQKYWKDQPFETIAELKAFIEDRIDRLERYDIQPGKEKGLLEEWRSLSRLADIIHHKLV